jgi:hypothetical protein
MRRQKRIHAARAASRHPIILERLRAGTLHLAGACLIAPHLTAENAAELADMAKGKSKRDIEFSIAGLSSRPVPGSDIVRLVPTGSPAPSATPADSGSAIAENSPSQRSAPDFSLEALTESLARIHFTASRGVLDKLERARALLRHRFPRGDYGDIIGEALDVLLDRKDPDRKVMTARRATTTDSRRIPQWVKDEVWKRDCGRCAFTAADGTRCGETAWLEYDHVHPFALGGRSDDPGNVRLLCRAHNQREAREAFG